MIVEIQKNDIKEVGDVNYPCIKEATYPKNFIIMFTSNNHGFVLSKGNSTYNIGDEFDGDEAHFKRFIGLLKLSNSAF